MTIEEYYRILERLDWYYAWSDDYGVFERGRASYTKAQVEANDGGRLYQDLLAAFQIHMFTGEPWGNTRAPKPQLKDYLEDK